MTKRKKQGVADLTKKRKTVVEFNALKAKYFKRDKEIKKMQKSFELRKKSYDAKAKKIEEDKKKLCLSYINSHRYEYTLMLKKQKMLEKMDDKFLRAQKYFWIFFLKKIRLLKEIKEKFYQKKVEAFRNRIKVKMVKRIEKIYKSRIKGVNIKHKNLGLVHSILVLGSILNKEKVETRARRVIGVFFQSVIKPSKIVRKSRKISKICKLNIKLNFFF